MGKILQEKLNISKKKKKKSIIDRQAKSTRSNVPKELNILIDEWFLMLDGKRAEE